MKMLSVRELIRELEKMPQNAKVLVHIKELGGFQRVEEVKIMDGKGFEWIHGEQVVVLDEKPFVPKRDQHQEEETEEVETEEVETEEELENLCPECSFFCEERFTDGQCK